MPPKWTASDVFAIVNEKFRDYAQQLQQIGVPPSEIQHVQPAAQQARRFSQHACSIAQQALSPEVQVMQQPSLVSSHLVCPQQRLHCNTVEPFQVQQQLQRPPWSMLQRFCNAPQATSLSQQQNIFNPPSHFSNRTSQRGSTHVLLGAEPVDVDVLIADIRSIVNCAITQVSL
jgi:hypothetical protein